MQGHICELGAHRYELCIRVAIVSLGENSLADLAMQWSVHAWGGGMLLYHSPCNRAVRYTHL